MQGANIVLQIPFSIFITGLTILSVSYQTRECLVFQRADPGNHVKNGWGERLRGETSQKALHMGHMKDGGSSTEAAPGMASRVRTKAQLAVELINRTHWRWGRGERQRGFCSFCLGNSQIAVLLARQRPAGGRHFGGKLFMTSEPFSFLTRKELICWAPVAKHPLSSLYWSLSSIGFLSLDTK